LTFNCQFGIIRPLTLTLDFRLKLGGKGEDFIVLKHFGVFFTVTSL
jgi:hypothetical protein